MSQPVWSGDTNGGGVVASASCLGHFRLKGELNAESKIRRVI
ncbi:hypothetical protein GGD55_006238 [Rhizobium giardinii]|uniref:Uncharacterized protein n=1 Tax=Rhizobium giardinii TaxID=56731 RepID=A0A7W8UHU0_9HYPH|nr:hypothetical protein [Rhizobium giardinii]